MLYAAHIEDKTLKHMWPCHLDRPAQTAASTAYAKNVCSHASYAKVTTSTTTQQNTQNCTQKPWISDVLFIKSEFPPLPTARKKQTSQKTTTASSSLTAAESSISDSATTPYDCKAELDRLSQEIEMTLCPQFECLFAQLEQKIDSLVQSREEQEKVNINVSKQLNFLVENITKLLKHLVYQLHNTTQSPRSSDGHS